MTLLYSGIFLWMAAHLFRRVFPNARAALTEKLGPASRGVFAGLIVLSVVMMVIGYKRAETSVWFIAPDFGFHINNLLMFVAVAFFGVGHSTSRLRGRLRHPMLLSVIIWAIAHIIVNGDQSSVVLFGGLFVWAVIEIILINAQEEWHPSEVGTLAGDIRLFVITAIIYALIAGLHIWLGLRPFPGGA